MLPIKTAIVEDTDSVRESLAVILNSSPGIQCVCACRNAEEALLQIPQAGPEVVLMDINLPGMSGVECVRTLKDRLPDLQIIMLTIESDSERVFRSLEAGATGYLVKHVPPERIVEAICEVHRGGSPMSGQIARMLVRAFLRNGQSRRAEENLTPREDQILKMIAHGFRSKEIADMLCIGANTVETHIRNIYGKLHVRSRAEAVAKMFNRGGAM